MFTLFVSYSIEILWGSIYIYIYIYRLYDSVFSSTIAKRTVTIYQTKTQTNKPKLNLEGFLMNHFLLLEMQE